jgi:hypothetical protein
MLRRRAESPEVDPSYSWVAMLFPPLSRAALVHSALVLLALVSASRLASAQSCIALPSDTPALGSPSSVPFGNNNPNDPIFSATRTQILVPRALLPAAPLRICDLAVAPAGSRLRRLGAIAVTLAHNPRGQLANPMSQNLGAPAATVRTEHWLLPTTANTWCSLGLPFDFVYDPRLGDLLVEFVVRDAGALSGSGTAGMRTSQELPYQWTTGDGESGTSFAGGGIKLRICTSDARMLVLGGGCPGSNGLVPRLDYAGSAAPGGTGFEVRLADGPSAPGSLGVLFFGFALRTTPLDLGVLGASGCLSHPSWDLSFNVALASGAQSLAFVVPPGIYPCLHAWNQWLVLEAGASALAIALSNPGHLLIAN